MTDVIMPKMGDGMEEGTLIEWLKKEGDAVKSGDVIGSIQTDKATLELEAPGSGKLAGFLIQNGETVPVGRPIAAILADGEKLPADWSKGSHSSSAPEGKKAEKTTANSESPSASEAESTDSSRIKASPLARKTAQQQGISLADVTGTGPGGRIIQEDVLAFSSKPKSAGKAEPKPAAAVSLPNLTAAAEDVVIPLNRLKKITGERTQQSKQAAPHIYVSVSVEIDRIIEIRSLFERDAAPKPSINDFVVRACALALKDMPLVNSSLTAQGILQHGAAHIGIAAAIEDGLTVPVIKHADQLSLTQISVQAKQLVQKAKENKLSLDELTGSTFSISNMGMLNVDSFCAIINLPNSAILAIGSAKKVVVPNEENDLEIKTQMTITGSFDHRVIDGAEAAKFMNIVKNYLERPSQLIS